MKHIKKISNYAMIGGFGAFAVLGLVGCESKVEQDAAFSQASKAVGAFVVIEEVSPKNYQVISEYPSEETRIILKDLSGNERILSKEELDKLVKEEEAKINSNQSPLTNPSLSSGGMSLGETILASAAGAIIGSWLGGKLFNSPAYNQQRQSAYKSPQAYSRSVNSFNKAKTSGVKSTSSKKSGFFGGSKTSTKSSSSFGG